MPSHPSHPSHHEKPHHHEESGPHEKLKPEEVARRNTEMQKHKAESLKARADILEYLSQKPALKWDTLNKRLILDEAHRALTPGNCESILNHLYPEDLTMDLIALGRNATTHTPSIHKEVQKKFDEGEAAIKSSVRTFIAKDTAKIFKSNTIKAMLALAAPILAESHRVQDAYTYCKKIMDFKHAIDSNQCESSVTHLLVVI